MDIKFSNNASTYLINAITDTDTEIIIAPGTITLFPTLTLPTDYFMLTLSDTNANIEIVKVTDVDLLAGSFSVERGQENTTPISFPINSVVEHRLTAGSLQHILNDSTASGSVPGRIRVATEDEFLEGIAADAAITPSLNYLYNLPVGAIVMYAGAVNSDGFIVDYKGDVNETWGNCDGRHNTPDLSSRFIMASSTEYPLHTAGGSNDDTTFELATTTEEHVLTESEIPSHRHIQGSSSYASGYYGSTSPSVQGAEYKGAHTSSHYTSSTGGGQGHAHDIVAEDITIPKLPAYYALTFIMKLR